MHFRSHDAPVSQPRSTHYRLSAYEDQFEITGAAELPVLRLIVHGPSTAFTFDRKETSLIPYRTERDRGYEWQESLEYGDLRSRDAAYHQGTVWPWLIGPYVDAWLKLNPGKEAEARRFLAGFVAHLDHRLHRFGPRGL